MEKIQYAIHLHETPDDLAALASLVALDTYVGDLSISSLQAEVIAGVAFVELVGNGDSPALFDDLLVGFLG